MTDTQAAYRVRIIAPRADADALSMLLNEALWPPPDAVGLFETTPELWQVDAYFNEKPDEAALRSFLAEQDVDAADMAIEAVPDLDWVSEVQSGLAPVHAGRFVVHGSHDRHRVPRSRWRIEIEAAQAFGTAHHGSTRGCLEALDRLARTTQFGNILDVGTGTGVLAIAAARLWGNAAIVASDIDPVATRIAGANARANGAPHIRAVTAESLAHSAIRQGAPYDLITANILARPLTALAPSMARILVPGGMIVLSGITRDQAGRVLASYGSVGFTRRDRITLEDWVTLTLERRQASP